MEESSRAGGTRAPGWAACLKSVTFVRHMLTEPALPSQREMGPSAFSSLPRAPTVCQALF